VFVVTPKADTVQALGTFYIRSDGSVDPPTLLIQRTGDLYTLTGNVNSSGNGIVIERDNIILDGAGYTAQGPGLNSSSLLGINLTRVSHVTIRSIKIKCFNWGIWLSSSSNNSIVQSNITENNLHGIDLYESSNNSLNKNNITYNGVGIMLASSSNNSINENTVTHNDEGIVLADHSSNNSVSGNSITINNDTGIYLAIYSNFNSIVGNTMKNNLYGVRLEYSSNNSISGNTVIASNYDGILIQRFSNHNSIVGNNVTASNDYGIEISQGFGNGISGNTVTNNSIGIFLNLSDNSTILGNNVVTNGYLGIQNDFSNNTEIIGNNIVGNVMGVIVRDHSYNASIIRNNITGNSGWGIQIYGSCHNYSICYNNFVNNHAIPQQASTDNTSVGVWDDGSIGNYWSDYQTRYPDASQIDSSGIWDTPYKIDSNNTDHYPLVDQYVVPEFPSILAVPLFMSMTLIAVIVNRRRQRRQEHPSFS
jgi:parallel beta-helix repeat protein